MKFRTIGRRLSANSALGLACIVITVMLPGIPGLCADDTAGLVIVQSGTRGALTLTRAGAGAVKGGCIPEFVMVCPQVGESQVSSTAENGMQVVRHMRGPKGQECLVTETFTPTRNSIRWEVAVACDNSKPWTTYLFSRVKYPATAKTRFWTSWSEGGPVEEPSPLPGKTKPIPDPKARVMTWNDPLVVKPLTVHQWGFGGGISIPIATFLEPEADTGISLAVSPDQPIVQLALQTKPDGTVQFSHASIRLGENRTVKFAADLVSHEADWRGGLRWMVNRYPEFFNPPNPKADAMAGTGSYSHHRGKLDEKEVTRLKKMAYRVNWAATFDWPYFGMYLPPMPNAEATWETSGHDEHGKRDPKRVVPMSYSRMNDECRYLKEHGFYQLNYFNVTEFGSQIAKPDAVKKDLQEEESWKDATTLLYRKFPNAICKPASGDAPIDSWSGSVVVDAADPAFKAHLLEMAKRHIENLPDSAGICIDRMDWLVRGVNYGADDGIGWYSNRPGRLLALSWNSLLTDLGKLMHSNGKVMFGNPSQNDRLDVARELDGFYDEYGHAGLFMNGSCLLALRKPAIMWTYATDKPDVDSYFQRHLYMGAYPTAPFIGNDHTINPSPTSDQPYFDYGPLLDAMRGKKWVLEPHCIEAAEGAAKVNLFSVPDGWVAPVTFGPKDGTVKVLIRNVPGISEDLKIEALLPGVEHPQPVPVAVKQGFLELQVPLHRGCAMVTIHKKLNR